MEVHLDPANIVRVTLEIKYGLIMTDHVIENNMLMYKKKETCTRHSSDAIMKI